MPEYLSPGVYVEEVEAGPKPIEGVGTSTAGFVGESERGPTAPTLVCSMSEYIRRFGGYVSGQSSSSISTSYLPYGVEGFFANGGKRCFIARIIGKDHTCSQLNIPASSDTSTGVNAGSRGVQSHVYRVTQSVLDELKTKGESEDVLTKLECLKNERFSEEDAFLERLKAAVDDNEVFKKLKPKVLSLASEKVSGSPFAGGGAVAFSVEAIGPGAWGNRTGIKLVEASRFSEGDPRLNKLFKVVVMYWQDPLPEPENVVDPTNPETMGNVNRRVPTAQEEYDNVSYDPAAADYFVTYINNRSNLVRVFPGGGQFRPEIPKTAKIGLLRGGSDGNPVLVADYRGTDDGPGRRTGLAAFGEVDEINMVCAQTDFNSEDDYKDLSNALTTHCETTRDRFAILQSRREAGGIEQLRPPGDSKYAAFYYPWVKVVEPSSGVVKEIPPGGHIAGIYARTDVERGVHKAPANAVVRGILGIQFPISMGEQDILNPRGVNCIRSFPGRGIRVWGARTISSDPEWKYINVRRLFLAIEEAIDEGTQWVVFEPNHQRLWARVKQSVSEYLTRVWRDGALMGNTPEEAFFVECGKDRTMTQDDIDNGRLIVQIGIAPVKPAEFVVFRIAQTRSGSEIME